MNKYSYLISSMTWSYSRLRCFEDCKYAFFLKYLSPTEEINHFFAEYGSLMHRVLEKFYKKEKSKEQLLTYYIIEFNTKLPKDSGRIDTYYNYYQQGIDYINGLQPLDEEIIGVEKNIEFLVGDYKFTGFVDLITKSDSGVVIQDNKSRVLKKSQKKKATAKDIEFSEYSKQLYLYGMGIKQAIGESPKHIRFNCFRNSTTVGEDYDVSKERQTEQWAIEVIHRIEQEEQWLPSPDWFRCKYICDFTNSCEYANMI